MAVVGLSKIQVFKHKTEIFGPLQQFLKGSYHSKNYLRISNIRNVEYNAKTYVTKRIRRNIFELKIYLAVENSNFQILLH